MLRLMGSAMLSVVAVAQLLLAARVFGRMFGSRNEVTIPRLDPHEADRQSVTVLVPVLNEEDRLAPCLASLSGQDATVAEILVIDGGSTDATRAVVERATALDPRITWVDASPVPSGINGKAYGLKVGAASASPATQWLLTVDADVRLRPEAVASLCRFARSASLRILSVATDQSLPTLGLGIVHPSMLTTLVYRFGIPGHSTIRVDRVQANGQCFLIDRSLLNSLGGFGTVLDTIAEDVTLARSAASTGERVGFYRTDGLVEVEMYRDAADAWRNWPRSLGLTDARGGVRSKVGLAECMLVQAAPMWLGAVGALRRWPSAFIELQMGLMIARAGVLAGTRRAYRDRPWTYWLSPAVDLPVIVETIRRSRQRRQRWRGREMTIGA